MRLIRSIQGRISGIRNTLESKYWEYTAYYSDAKLWEDTILFESFGGVNFQGNPYYLFKEFFLNADYVRYKFVIVHQKPEQIIAWLQEQGLVDDRVTVVQKNTHEYRNALAHSKYLVNNVSFNMDFIKKPGQVYLNTWHGTPLKCLGRNIRNDPFECNNAQRNFLLCDYLIAPNELTKRVYEDDYMVHGIMPGQILLSGYPRNSVFFDDHARARVKNKYIMTGVTSILFMPTWRGTACGVENVDQVSEIEKLAKDLGEDYRIYVKFHPAMKTDGRSFRYCHSIPEDIEVYEFLNAVDILITDYSSVFFDFASSGKTIILYQYDKEQYYRSRGVYDEIARMIPFPVVYCYDELLNAVKKEKQQLFSEFVEDFCRYDGISATAETAGLLVNEIPPKINNSGVDLYVIDFPITETQLLQLKEKLDGTNYRFVFTLKRGTKHFAAINCWEKLDYLALYMYDRLSLPEKVQYLFGLGLYSFFRCKWAQKIICTFGFREQRRLWGEMKINRIFAKDKRLPVAVQPFVEEWPQDLN